MTLDLEQYVCMYTRIHAVLKQNNRFEMMIITVPTSVCSNDLNKISENHDNNIIGIVKGIT